MSTLDLPRPGSGLGREEEGVPRPAGLRAGQWSLTVEQLAYVVIGLLALFAHLWMLGERALHHDETLHASYSWYLFKGRGYIHDPLLHGPLLYYIGALKYFLFGDNDFTARLGAALAGTALTLTPYLIRRELGRPAALIAAGYLLVSPVALYVGRFIRHDIYSALCEALVFVAIVRYASSPSPRWLYLGAAAFGLMLVNQETSYLFLLIMGTPLILLFLARTFPPGVLMMGGLGVAAVLLAFVLPAHAQVDGSHNAIRDPQTGAMVIERPGLFPPLPTEDNGYALRIRNRADDDGGRSLIENLGRYLSDLSEFAGHPAVLLGLGLAVATIGALFWLIWRRPGRDGLTPWQAARERGDPAVAVFATLAQGRRWLIALLIFLGIYAVFFTAFFTNLLGLITGTTGSLLYWLAQHNVERGGQPAHYYAVMLMIYEPLLLIFGAVALFFVGYDLLRRQKAEGGRQSEDKDGAIDQPTESGHELLLSPTPGLPLDPSASLPFDKLRNRNRAGRLANRKAEVFCMFLLAWWTIGAFAIYTWAGEKMPWLTIHLSLPLTLLAAWGFQRIVWGRQAAQPTINLEEDPEAHAVLRFGFWVYSALFAAIVGLGFVLMTAIVGFGNASILPPWVIPIFSLALIAMLTLGAGLRWGRAPALAMLAVCVGVSIGVYTARSSYRLSFENGDTPREMMVYTQTSPDVMRVVRRLEEASRRRGGRLELPVIYDNETVWSWYLRDFPNAQRSGEQLSGPPGPEVMAVLMLQENIDRYPENLRLLDGFVVQRYPLRWWFPEDQIYRLNPGWRELPLENASLLGQVLRAPLDRDVNVRLWRFLIFRETNAPLGSTDFVVAVRPELASQIGFGLGGSLTGGEP